MAQTPIHTTIVGRLTADPEVRYTNDGELHYCQLTAGLQ